jgi:hypothetical protein
VISTACGAISEPFPLSSLFMAAQALLVRFPGKSARIIKFLLKNSTMPEPACQEIVDRPD